MRQHPHSRDRVQSAQPEKPEEYLELHLHLSGTHENDGDLLGAGQYCLYGSGLMPKAAFDLSERQPFLEVQILIRKDLLRSVIGDSDGELPAALQPWVRSPEQPRYKYFGTATPAMQWAARQMLRCRFQAMSKRLFLEGKSLELLGLAVAAEMARHEGYRPSVQPDLLARVHHARDILRQRLDNPPSLGELARLVGLNEYTLKQEFRRVFGITVFGYLHDYRMNRAWQELVVGDCTVKEVARRVGYTNLPAFSRAFSKRFNINPRDCLPKHSV
ncbi:helix-turn-helix transcriptional regulator [Pleurocapsales cyanobacterium LEGE 06147]|nr:helix-turn-helix transcriptional regulator [Pleurocapsales cyanobacterium LEGE 06147]